VVPPEPVPDRLSGSLGLVSVLECRPGHESEPSVLQNGLHEFQVDARATNRNLVLREGFVHRRSQLGTSFSFWSSGLCAARTRPFENFIFRLTEPSAGAQNDVVEPKGPAESRQGVEAHVRLEEVLGDLGIHRRTFEEWRRRGVLPRNLNPTVRRGSRPGGGRGGSVSTWPDALREVLWLAQLVARATRGAFGRLGTRRSGWSARGLGGHRIIRCALWASGSDYDPEVIRRDLIQFNEGLRELTLKRGSMKYRRRRARKRATKDEQDAIEDLVVAQSDWFEKVRRFFPGLLPRRDDATERKLQELLVDQDSKGPLVDRILQAVREATAEHFELARQVLGARFQLCLGSLLGLLARRELGIAGTDEEEVALELCKKELRCLPVYAAYFVYLAVMQPAKLNRLRDHELSLASTIWNAEKR
jgi:hypothetical protein